MATRTGPRHDVESLRRDHPITEVIARYGIELRATGRSLVGRCPFHDDGGRPNLHVYPENQRWFCYRCSVGGDAIDFIRRQEHLSFVEACERLAGIPSHPPIRSPACSPKREQRWDRLTLEEQVVMNTACAFYHHTLWREPRALHYLHERGIPDSVSRRCALGYADGHSLESYLRHRAGVRTAQDLGLLRKTPQGNRELSFAEFLAGRIVVPEFRSAQCVWFIGRDLREDERRPKFLALSGERPVLGLERVLGCREVFLVEGVFDYLTAVSWKLPAFSPCGTHLPPERSGFLARAEMIYGVLDGDAAGQEAAKRFEHILGPRFRPLRLPDEYDLNDLARRPYGRQEFFRLLLTARQERDAEHRHEV